MRKSSSRICPNYLFDRPRGLGTDSQSDGDSGPDTGAGLNRVADADAIPVAEPERCGHRVCAVDIGDAK